MIPRQPISSADSNFVCLLRRGTAGVPAPDPQHGGQAAQDLGVGDWAGLYRGGRHVGHGRHRQARPRGPTDTRRQVHQQATQKLAINFKPWRPSTRWFNLFQDRSTDRTIF